MKIEIKVVPKNYRHPQGFTFLNPSYMLVIDGVDSIIDSDKQFLEEVKCRIELKN